MYKNKMQISDKSLETISYVMLTVIALCTLYPTLFIVASSLSSGSAVAKGAVFLLPVDWTISAYKVILSDFYFLESLWQYDILHVFWYFVQYVCIHNSGIFIVEKTFEIPEVFNFLLAFTIWFDPGIIPKYMNFKQLGLENNRLGIVIGFGVLAFNIIILRNYFESVPKSLDEAAYIDGANQFQILSMIYMPLSKAAIATVTLFYAISRWNGYFGQ